MATEQPFWFDGGGTRLFGVYHPATTDEPPRAALVFVHPLFEEKKSAHRILVDTARTLAAAGVAVLRFDLAGCGDSEGALDAQSPSVWQDNICAAARYLAQRLPDTPLGVLGVRMGGTLALSAAIAIPAIKILALWEPVPDGAAWLRERLRQRLVREMLASGRAGDGTAAATGAEQQSLDVDGFRLSPRLAQDIETINVSSPDAVNFNGSVLILKIGSASRPAAAVEALCTRLNTNNAAAEIRHVRAPPFWNRLEPQPCPEAAATTLDWLTSVLSIAASTTGTKGEDAENGAAIRTPGLNPAPNGSVEKQRDDFALHTGEQPLTFGAHGRRLHGILHPACHTDRDPARIPAVLFLHGWGAYRIGPHRMFVHAARFFAGQGNPVLRFDFAGRGDSEGVTEDATIDSMAIDAGRALATLRDAAPDHPLVILGMCSGAKVAAAVAAKHAAEVNGVVLWSPEPPDEAEQAAGGIKRVRRRGDVLRAYWGKLIRPSVWRKVITGGVNWRLVHRALVGRRGPKTNERERDRTVYRAFGSYPGRRLLVFGTADPSADTARKQHRRLAQGSDAEYTEHGIENADHNFYDADWERAVIEISAAWLLTPDKTKARENH